MKSQAVTSLTTCTAKADILPREGVSDSTGPLE